MYPSLCSTIMTFFSVLNISLDSSKMSCMKEGFLDKVFPRFLAFLFGFIFYKSLYLFSDFETIF